jgi:hypothetical protein
VGGILGGHIVHRNCVKPLVQSSVSGEARYLCVRLRFGLELSKDLLAFLCCLGSFGAVGDMEFPTSNINIFRMGEHLLFAKLRGRVLIIITQTPALPVTVVIQGYYFCELSKAVLIQTTATSATGAGRQFTLVREAQSTEHDNQMQS